MKKTIGIIILAAGSSTRLGQPKQLLEFNGKTLLRHTVDEALLARPAEIIVVTGADHEAVEDELISPEITIVRNEYWSDGMGTSIKKGLEELLTASPEISAVILAVCDQPFVNAEIFKALINTYRLSGKLIIASAYSGTFGTPALYDAIYFKDLLDLKGTEGAKKLIQNNSNSMTFVQFEKGAIDIDTPDDYHQLTLTK